MACKTFRMPPKPEPVILIDGAEVRICDMPDASVDPEALARMRGNTMAWRALWPKLNDEALIRNTQYYLAHCSRDRSGVTYDAAVVRDVVPELLRRLQARFIASVGPAPPVGPAPSDAPEDPAVSVATVHHP